MHNYMAMVHGDIRIIIQVASAHTTIISLLVALMILHHLLALIRTPCRVQRSNRLPILVLYTSSNRTCLITLNPVVVLSLLPQ
jgi:hypothetical protein